MSVNAGYHNLSNGLSRLRYRKDIVNWFTTTTSGWRTKMIWS